MLAAIGWTAAGCGPAAFAQVPAQAQAQAPVPLVGELKSLGQDRYQIGRIVVDKRARSFTVPGRVNVLGRPIEYFATTPGGMKAYEALFELDATGSEFNLACILVGLERDPKLTAPRPTRQTPIAGQRVAISIAWSEGGRRRLLSAAEALLNPEAGVKPESVEWVYTGSMPADGGTRLAADRTGTLIGFIHNASTIIDSGVPIGLGAYGSVQGNALLPPVGSAVELLVEVAAAK